MPKNRKKDGRLEDYLDSAWEGGKAGFKDLEHVVLHPIDTATDSAITVFDLIADTTVYVAGPDIFNEGLYTESVERMQKRDQAFRKLISDLQHATGPDYAEILARGTVGGLGSSAALKLIKKLGKVPKSLPANPDYYDKVREYSKLHRTLDPHYKPFETIDMVNRLSGINELSRQSKSLRSSAAKAAFSFGVVYGASDKEPSPNGFSFFNEAQAQERSTPQSKSEPVKKPISSTEREHIKKNLQVDDNHLDHIVALLEEAQAKRDFGEKIQASKELFSDLGNIGQHTGNELLTKFSAIGYQSVRISENLEKLQKHFPQLQGLFGVDSILGNFLSGASMVQPGVAVVSIIMSFLNKPKPDPIVAMNIQYFTAILSSLNTIRKEMHELKGELSAEIKEGKVQSELNYYKLKHLLQMHHDIGLKNMNQVTRDLGEDIHQFEQVMSSLMKQSLLNNLDTLLVYLKFDSVTENELRKILIETPQIWLLKELVSHNLNGGIYSSDSTRQDLHFVGHGILDVGSALGYLANYDREVFADIDTSKLPFLQVWIYTLNAFLLAKNTATQRDKKELDLEHIPELMAVADNTLQFIHTSVEKAPLLYKKLAVKYTNAVESLYTELAINLAQALRVTDKAYSLNKLVELGLVSTTDLEKKLGAQLVKTILSSERAQEPTIPLLAVLIGKLELAKFGFLKSEYTPPLPPYVTVGVQCAKDKKFMDYYNFAVSGRCILQVQDTRKAIDIASTVFEKKSVKYYSECHKEKSVGGYAKKADAISKATHANCHIHSLLAEAKVQAHTPNQYAQSSLNEEFVNQIAVRILEEMKSGKNLEDLLGKELAPEASKLFSQAVTSTLEDTRSNENAINTLAVTQKLAIAYGELIGMHQEAIQNMTSLMPSDARYVLQHPEFAKILPNITSSLNDVVVHSIPNRLSDVESQMMSAVESMKSYSLVVTFKRAYQENLQKWQLSLESYAQLFSQIDYMERINALPEVDFSTGLYHLHLLLEYAYDHLVTAYTDLTELGYDLPMPKSLEEGLNTPAPESEKESENDLFDTSEIPFSPYKAAELVEESINYMDQLPHQTKKASIRIGVSGATKSTLTNFQHGTDYHFYFNDDGQTFVAPGNDIPEVSPTGYGKSITKLPILVEVEETIHVDLPGSSDDDGIESDIARAIQIQKLPSIFNRIQAIELVVTHDDIYNGRFTRIAQTFREGGLIIADSPKENAKHILITITKPNAKLLESVKGDLKAYQQKIYKHLKNWYEHSISKLKESDSDYPIKHLLENLDENQIVVVDVTNPDHRALYQDRMDAIPSAPVNQFNFNSIDKDARLFNQFIEKLTLHHQSIESDILSAKQALGAYWKKALQTKVLGNAYNFGDAKNDVLVQDLVIFDAIQQAQFDLYQHIGHALNLAFDKHSSIQPGLVGSIDSVVEKIVYLTSELKKTGPLLERLKQVVIPKASDPIEIEDDEMFFDTLDAPKDIYECTESSWSFPPVACAQPLTSVWDGKYPYKIGNQQNAYGQDATEITIKYTGDLNGQIYFFAWLGKSLYKLALRYGGFDEKPAAKAQKTKINTRIREDMYSFWQPKPADSMPINSTLELTKSTL